MSLLRRCKRLWLWQVLRGVRYNDRHRQLDVLYRVRDPWDLNCKQEWARFEATNSIIRREFGHLPSILELGCGEGLHSSVLAGVCNSLYGIDVSPIAVARARARCHAAIFEVGDITKLDDVAGRERFDLVVGCEMLYYVKNVRQCIDRMSQLGAACLVTYYTAQRERLDPEILQQRGVQWEVIRCFEREWIAAWWTNAP